MSEETREGGFVLVEAIAALGVAAIAAAALMTALGASSARSNEARIRELALRQARALVEETLTAPQPAELERRGKLSDLSWTRTVEETGDPYPGLLRVSVEIAWTSLQKKGATHLDAYRVAPPQTP